MSPYPGPDWKHGSPPENATLDNQGRWISTGVAGNSRMYTHSKTGQQWLQTDWRETVEEMIAAARQPAPTEHSMQRWIDAWWESFEAGADYDECVRFADRMEPEGIVK